MDRVVFGYYYLYYLRYYYLYYKSVLSIWSRMLVGQDLDSQIFYSVRFLKNFLTLSYLDVVLITFVFPYMVLLIVVKMFKVCHNHWYGKSYC